MSTTAYNAITVVLLVGVCLAFIIALVSFVAAIVRWKTPRRSGYILRGAVALVAIPCLIGIQQALLWRVFLPEFGRQQRQEYEAQRAQQNAESSLVGVGDPVPPFTVDTIDGKSFSVEETRGDVVVINFFATWCGPCLQELPHVERLWKEYRDKPGFHLLVIGRGESVESVQSFRKKHGFSFPMAADPDRAIFSRFATQSIPRTLLISREGTIVTSLVGFHAEDFDALKTALDRQLAQRPEPRPE
jgi:peroxiredoxin